MQKQKNSFIAGVITIAILSAMTGSISALQAKEKDSKAESEIVQAQKPTVNDNPDDSSAAPAAITSTSVVVPVPTVASTPNTPITSTHTTPPTSTVASAPTPTPTPAPTPIPIYTYKNGTYPTTVSYSVPGTVASINVSLTVFNDKITASSVSDPPSTDPTSKNWDNRFISDYKQYVIGQALSTLNLSNTSGASLTTAGFNNAVTQIRNAAR